MRRLGVDKAGQNVPALTMTWPQLLRRCRAVSLGADNDTLVFFDYRSDRMREIVETIGFASKHFQTDTVRQGLVRRRSHGRISLQGPDHDEANLARLRTSGTRGGDACSTSRP